MPIDVTTLEKAGRTTLVNLFKETLIKEVKIYKDGSSDVINNNTEHTPWKNYIFQHRLQSKTKKDFNLQDFNVPLARVNVGSSDRRVASGAVGNIVVHDNFTKRGAYTVLLNATDDDGLIVDIPYLS